MSFIAGLVLIVLIISVTMIILLFVSSRYSHQGRIFVHSDEDGIQYSLEIDGDPYDIQHMKSVSFKVVKNQDSAN